MRTRERLYSLMTALMIAAITIIVYLPNTSNELLGWDDDNMFVDNAHFGSLSWQLISWATTTTHYGNYQPLAWLLWSAQHTIAGLDANAFYLTSTVLHALNAACVFVTLMCFLRLTSRDQGHPSSAAWLSRSWSLRLAAACSTLLYALSPVRVEPVSWISAQSYLPSSICALLAISLYCTTHTTSRRRVWAYVGVTLLYTAAVLFKVAAMPLPLILLILDIWPLNRTRSLATLLKSPSLWLEKSPMFGIAMAVSWMAVSSKIEADSLYTGIDVLQAAMHASVGMGLHLYHTLVPLRLSPYYTWPTDSMLQHAVLIIGLCSMIGLVILSLFMRKRHPAMLVATSIYLLALLPTAQVVRIGNQVTADRYSYLAIVVWFAILAAVIDRWLRRPKTAIPTLVVVAVAATCSGVLTQQQLAIWKDDHTLWKHAVTLDPHCAVGHFHLGNHHAEQQQYAVAHEHYLQAQQLQPEVPEFHFRLGLVCAAMGKTQQAFEHYIAALSKRPSYAQAHNNLGVLLMNHGHLEQSETHLTQAAQLDPGFVDAHYNLGLMRANKRMFRDALTAYATALKLDPDNARVHAGIGAALLQTGKHSQALFSLKQAIALDPTLAEAHNNIAVIFLQQRDFESAVPHLQETVRLLPNAAGAHANLGIALLELQQLTLAIEHLQKALEIDPRLTAAEQALTQALQAQSSR